MSDPISHDVRKDTGSVRTVAEFEALVEHLRRTNPAAYHAQTDNGYFDRFRKTLVDYVAPVSPKVVSAKANSDK